MSKKEISLRKEVNKEVNKINVYLYICVAIQNQKNISMVCKKLKVSKQYVNRYVKVLKDALIIVKRGYGVWELTDGMTIQKARKIISHLKVKNKRSKHLSLGARRGKEPLINIHGYSITIPILSGKIIDKDWEIKEMLNNWTPKHTKLNILGGLSIRNNNNKSITVNIHERDVSNVEEIPNLLHQVRDAVSFYFKSKMDVVLDIYNTKTGQGHNAIEDDSLQNTRKKGSRVSVNFKKPAEKIFPRDNKESIAWVDGSPYLNTAESNDIAWIREYLKMPFTIQELLSNSETSLERLNFLYYLFEKNIEATHILQGFAEQVAVHLEVEQSHLKNTKEMNILMKQNNELFQKLLEELKRRG